MQYGSPMALNSNAYLESGNPATMVDRLADLSSNPDSRIRRHVAENSSAPLMLLLLLTGDPSDDVRLAVAENPNFPQEFLCMFIRDKSDDLRYGLAENSNLPLEVLLGLSKDENPYVAERAQKTLCGRQPGDSPIQKAA